MIRRFIIIIGLTILILSNTSFVSSETHDTRGLDEYRIEDYTLILLFSFIGIIPEFYLGKKISEFINQQKMIEGVKPEDD
jgi:hypothetical protein